MQTLIVFSENSLGLLHSISAMFTRRRLNIESLTVSETEKKGISRYTIVLNADEDLTQKVARQIRRVIEVRDVLVCKGEDLIEFEVALIRVNTKDAAERSSLEALASRHGAEVVAGDEFHLVLQKSGPENEVKALFLMLEGYGIAEYVRSGRTALTREYRACALE